ncbi:MAG: hypothetical protein KIT87_11920 [Anaerolineae bacterium]|nr:hypothetical protein [Anaerolineae bacterium]
MKGTTADHAANEAESPGPDRGTRASQVQGAQASPGWLSAAEVGYWQQTLGNQAVGRLLRQARERQAAAPSSQLRVQRQGLAVQRSWIGDRTDWVRTATRAGNWVGDDPPGAYSVLNGMSMEDMVRILQALTGAERKKLSDNLDEHGVGLDQARMHQGLMRASAAAGESFFQDLSDKVHAAIRANKFGEYPDGAFWIINPLNAQDRAKIMRFLARDHLDELIAHRGVAVAAGVPNANLIVGEATTVREGQGATAKEKSIANLIPGAQKAGAREVQTGVTDCGPAFKALAALNDFDLRRAIRALSRDKRSTLEINIDQVDGLGIDGNRLRHFIRLADTTSDELRASLITDGIWQPNYKQPPGDYSHTLKVNLPGSVTATFDLVIDEVGDEEMSAEEVDRLWGEAKIGRGGLLWPAKLNKSTVPNLWGMKQSVRQQIANWHGQDILFIIQAFLAVEFVLHLGVGITMPQMTSRPRGSGPPKPGAPGGEEPATPPGTPPPAKATKPSAPPGYKGPQHKFGDEIGWPKEHKGSATEVPPEKADLGKLRQYGGDENWASEQAQLYRDIAKKNPKNPTAARRADWLDQVANRLKNEPPSGGPKAE